MTAWLSQPVNWVFLAIGLVTVGAAVGVVTRSNVVHAALLLVAALGGTAALFLMVGAEFVAWAVVLVYVGAVIVLFLFGIMITRAPIGQDPALDHSNRWPAVLTAALVFFLMAGSSWAAFGDTPLVVGDDVVRAVTVGESLISRFVVPFEVVGFLLLAALIGGITLARRDPHETGEEPRV